jgi:hypothetical protein
MKRILSAFLIVSLAVISTPKINAQCKGFAKKMCKLELIPYIHDGNYNAAILTEGEEAELYKTFFSGQDYRLAVCASDNLEPIEFKVVDANRKVLFDNKDNELSKTWDFKLESSQQLKIVVKIPVKEGETMEPHSGCVAIMFGFKEK